MVSRKIVEDLLIVDGIQDQLTTTVLLLTDRKESSIIVSLEEYEA